MPRPSADGSGRQVPGQAAGRHQHVPGGGIPGIPGKVGRIRPGTQRRAGEHASVRQLGGADQPTRGQGDHQVRREAWVDGRRAFQRAGGHGRPRHAASVGHQSVGQRMLFDHNDIRPMLGHRHIDGGVHRHVRADQRAKHVLRAAPDNLVSIADEFLSDREHGIEMTFERQYHD